MNDQLHAPAVPLRGKSPSLPSGNVLSRKLGGPQSRVAQNDAEENLPPLPRIEPRVLSSALRFCITIPTELARLSEYQLYLKRL